MVEAISCLPPTPTPAPHLAILPWLAGRSGQVYPAYDESGLRETTSVNSLRIARSIPRRPAFRHFIREPKKTPGVLHQHANTIVSLLNKRRAGGATRNEKSKDPPTRHPVIHIVRSCSTWNMRALSTDSE